MTRNPAGHRSLVLFVVLAFAAFGASVRAAPQINNVSPRGLQAGKATKLTITGSGFRPDTRILLNLPGGKQFEQSVESGVQANRIQLDVSVPADAPQGIYHLRLADPTGVSNAAAVGLDSLPQLPFAEAIKKLPVALHGALTGGTTLATEFAGKSGQRIVIDVEAKRLGSALNPVLEVYGPRGRLLGTSQYEPALAGDARLDVKLPADGSYSVRLHDALYRGGSPSHFRLKVGELHYADMAFPLAVTRGKTAALQFVRTNLPPDVQVTMTPSSPGRYTFAAWPSDKQPCAGRPIVRVSDNPQVVETPEEGKPQEVAVPAGINGRIAKPGEKDRYLLRVRPGMKLRFDVWAKRAGSPLDGLLTVARENGGGLGSNDDRQDTVDPGLEVAVPGGVNALIVTLEDRLGVGGEDFVYHIDVENVEGGDFSLTAFADRYLIPESGHALVRVRANRSGYNGAIKLSVDAGSLHGVKVSGDTIPPGATDTLLTLSADQGAANRPATWVTSLVGEATGEGSTNLRRPVLLAETPITRVRPSLREEIALAVVPPRPLSIVWGENAPGESFEIGGKLNLSVNVTRSEKAAGAVRLALVTSQIVPKIKGGKDNGKPDTAKALRVEKAVTIPADQDAATLSVVAPGSLPRIEYDFAVRAELLSADGKQVIARAVTPARRVKANAAAKTPKS